MQLTSTVLHPHPNHPGLWSLRRPQSFKRPHHLGLRLHHRARSIIQTALITSDCGYIGHAHRARSPQRVARITSGCGSQLWFKRRRRRRRRRFARAPDGAVRCELGGGGGGGGGRARPPGRPGGSDCDSHFAFSEGSPSMIACCKRLWRRRRRQFAIAALNRFGGFNWSHEAQCLTAAVPYCCSACQRSTVHLHRGAPCSLAPVLWLLKQCSVEAVLCTCCA